MDRRFDTSRNFLATDKVPETIFGIPVVSRKEDYTEEDLAFFREHPEAGGYYDLEGDEPESQADEMGGDSSEHLKRNGNLSPLGRKRYLFRDRNGKVEAYGTQDSVVMLDSDRGEYVAIPTIVDGRAPMSDKDAFAHYKKTGEFFHRSKDAGEAKRAAHEAHLESADEGRAWWNNYIADHIDDGTLGPDLMKMRDDPGFMKWARGEDPDSEMKRVRQDAKGGNADEMGGDAMVSKVNRAIAKVVPFLKEEGHEGFRPAAYQDSVGKWTVGYGQTEIMDPKTGRIRPVAKGDTISEKDASAFVEQRVRANAAALHREHPGWSENLSDGALAALYDVAYNMGTGALSAKRSPNLNSELDSADMDHDSIVWRELPSYSKAGGKTLPGLLKRRNDAIARWRK